MDRIINLKVFGNHVTKDSDYAGVRGEANVTNLKITFDEGWDDYAKKAIFWDAHGENPVSILLLESGNVFIVPIPGEAMAYAGEMTISIEGTLNGAKQVSATCTLRVADSPDASNISNAYDPTSPEGAQILEAVDAMKDDVAECVATSKKIEAMSASVTNLDSTALAFVDVGVNASMGYHFSFGIPAGKKGDSGPAGATGPQGPAGRDGKSPRIGENGNWFDWNVESERYEDTGTKAKGPKGDTGDTGPRGIQGPRGVSGKDGTNGKDGVDGLTPHIGSNGNWWIGGEDKKVKAQGPKGDTGERGKKGEKGDTGPQGPQGEQGKDGASGLPTVMSNSNTSLVVTSMPVYTEIRCTSPLLKLIIRGFKKNTANPGNDMWAITFTADEGISVSVPTSVEWAVADPVFTAGYTYYLSFIPFGEKILGVWVAKELS